MTGNPTSLAVASKVFQSDGTTIEADPNDAGTYRLSSSRFLDCADDVSVLRIAQRLVVLASAAGSLSMGSPASLAVDRVYKVDDDGSQTHFQICRDNLLIAVHESIGVVVNGVPQVRASRTIDAPRTMETFVLLEANPRVLVAYHELEGAKDWPAVFVAYEAVEAALGGRRKLLQCGLLSKADFEMFEKNANNHRHHVVKRVPREMTLDEGRRFVLSIIRDWIQMKLGAR